MKASFTAVTFNIFARSLGSSVIPWVLNISPEAQAIISRSKVNPKLDIKDWLKRTATIEYKQHFHRNFASGDKELMRGVWSARIDSREDVPLGLPFVTCVKPDELQYPGKIEAAGSAASAICESQTAITFRGLLRRDIPDVADELFNEFVSNEEFFKWENRGPEIFEIATKRAISELLPEESCPMLSDLVTLCEVETHFSLALVLHECMNVDSCFVINALTQPVRRTRR